MSELTQKHCHNCNHAVGAQLRFCPDCGEGVAAPEGGGTMTGTSPAAPQAPPATPLTRLGAVVVDSVIIMMASIIVLIAIVVVAAVLGNVSTVLASLVTLIGYLALLAGALGYFAWFLGVHGQTIGKRILGVKVIDIASDRPMGMGRALLRTFVFYLLGTPCYLGYLTVFLDQTGRFRGWHDLAASTRVIAVAPTSVGKAFSR